MIALQGRDFPAAAAYLHSAWQHKPQHPGVRKALAYALVWNGQIQQALPLLHTLPQARQHPRHYARW